MNINERDAYINQFRDREVKTKLATLIPTLKPNLSDVIATLTANNKKGLEPPYYPNDPVRNGFHKLLQLNQLDQNRLIQLIFPELAKVIIKGLAMIKHGEYTYAYAGVRGIGTSKSIKRNSDWIPHYQVEWLQSLWTYCLSFNQNIRWHAQHADPYYFNQPHWSHSYLTASSHLFRAAIEINDEHSEWVLNMLIQVTKEGFKQATFGQHLLNPLLTCTRHEAWNAVAEMLVNTQRQEGLRQSILETATHGQRGALITLITTINKHNLVRFNSVVRAVNKWFKLDYDVTDSKAVQNAIVLLDQLISNQEFALRMALEGEPQQVYFALIALALTEEAKADKQASIVLNQKTSTTDQRLAAALFLKYTHTLQADKILLTLTQDSDIHIQAHAIAHSAIYATTISAGTFKHIESTVLPTISAKNKQLPARIWPWLATPSPKEHIGQLLYHVARQEGVSLKHLFPHFKRLDSWNKRSLIDDLLKDKQSCDTATRAKFFEWVGDLDKDVRNIIAKTLYGSTFSEAEIIQLEGLMHRKAADLRRNIIQMILAQTDNAVLASSQRMLKNNKLLIRQAGLELLAELFESDRKPAACRQMTATYRKERPKLSATETSLLNRIPADAADDRVVLTLEDGLGLINNSNRTKPIWPQQSDFVAYTEKTLEFVRIIDNLIQDNADFAFTFNRHPETHFCIGSGSQSYSLPTPRVDRSREENRQSLPKALREWWLNWWNQEGSKLIQSDPFELVRANVLIKNEYNYVDRVRFIPDLTPDEKFYSRLRHQRRARTLLEWMLYLFPPLPDKLPTFLLDGMEHTLHSILSCGSSQKKWWLNPKGYDPYLLGFENWFNLAELSTKFNKNSWETHHWERYWGLLRWLDEPQFEIINQQHGNFPEHLKTSVSAPMTAENLQSHLLGQDLAKHYTQLPRRRPDFDILIPAYDKGLATEDDILDHLINARNLSTIRPEYVKRGEFYYSIYRQEFETLIQASGRKPHQYNEYWGIKQGFHPAAQAAVQKVRQRIIEVELTRGDLPTPASVPAKCLAYSGGTEVFVNLLKAFGKDIFLRGYAYDGESKRAVFSHLIRASAPTDGDTPKAFVKLAKAANLPDQRWVEAALYAPQWAKHIEKYLNWPNLADAVWWFHAHTKDKGWHVGQEMREVWAAETNERTPLAADDLENGAVDVSWFNRVYASLGKAKWEMLDQAAKYTSSGIGHKRAQLFANAMLGWQDQDELFKRLKAKRHQDSARALGLLPLPTKPAERENELLTRYTIHQEFLKGTKKFGSQRQASEKLAVRIGMENLARNAGYPDPIRLQWAMERHEIADLAHGPVSASADDVTVTLSINALGEAEISISRELKSGKLKTLKSVPAKLKKHPEIAALTGRKTAIRQQASRVRRSLEEAMIRGDRFTQAELATLFEHSVIKPMIQQLVFILQDGTLGYPTSAGKQLVGLDDQTVRLKRSDKLRLAHPHDLLQNDWHLWQKECFQQKRIQPFKQIFRELYIVTPVEEEAKDVSRRYAGQEVNPRQASRLFAERGWINHPYEGTRKTWHDEKMVAHVDFTYDGYTPAEVGGETFESVYFTKIGEWKSVPLVDVPPRLFSESMRDLDLVVSVAHLSGFDPESTESTAELRGSLARETAELLQLANVTVKGRHILIDGQINSYSVHLGSGIIHQRPGGYVCIVPVHNSQRGLVFLPFVDKDLKTAEIIAKMVMLANDKKIKDPTILQQLMLR